MKENREQTDIELRVTPHKVELRKDGEGESEARKIVGYAAMFGTLSENLGGFREIIEPGAFDGRLEDDVRALFNHDRNHVLGRNGTTMALSVDAVGLRYEIDPPNTQAAHDLMELLARGDVDQSSFGFTVEQDEWIEDDEQRTIRKILKVRRLYDVSPVTYPAYPDTQVALRSMAEARPDLREDPKVFNLQKFNELEARCAELEEQNARLQESADMARRMIG